MPAEQLAGSYAGQLGQFIEPILQPLGFDWRIGIGLIASFAAREVFVSTMAIIYSVGVATEAGLESALRAQTTVQGTVTFTPLVCLSLLVFFVYAMQCISTVAVVKRETNSWRWPLFQLFFMTAVAYGASLIVYQGGKLIGFH
jgi:ferrous iron transport protein B